MASRDAASDEHLAADVLTELSWERAVWWARGITSVDNRLVVSP